MLLLSLLLIQRSDINNNAVQYAVPRGATASVDSLLHKGFKCYIFSLSSAVHQNCIDCVTTLLYSAWDDFWPTEEGNQDDQPNGYQTGKNPDIDVNQLHLYVKHAHFEKLSSGAISYTKNDPNKKMLIELSSFLDITKKGYGAGIHIINGGHNIVNKVCALGCFSTAGSSDGEFLYASLSTNDVTKKNIVIDSSICFCKEEKYTSEGILYLVNSNISIHTVNLTNNKSYWMAPLYIKPTLIEGETTSFLKYSSVRNNSARFEVCINQEMDNAGMRISRTNIIENRQNTTSFGIVNVDGPTYIVDCTVLENDEKCEWLHVDEVGYIEIVDCTIDADYESHMGTSVTYDSITPMDGILFINAIKHTENEYCAAAYDFVGSLTPNLGFPNNLCSKKPDHMNDDDDDDMNIKSSKRRIFEYIFVVSCLNVDPSVGLWDEKK